MPCPHCGHPSINKTVCFGFTCNCFNYWVMRRSVPGSLSDVVNKYPTDPAVPSLNFLLAKREVPTAASKIQEKLYEIIEKNDPDLLTHFLNNTPCDFITINPFKKYFRFNYELKDIDWKIIDILLKRNAIVNYGCHRNSCTGVKTTLLHKACESRNLTFVKLLVNEGADVNASDKYFYSPLDKALDNNLKDIAEFLLLCGACEPGVYYEDVKRAPAKQVLLHLANLNGNFQSDWGSLSNATYNNEEVTVVSLLDTKEFSIDVLTLYCGVVCGSYEIFKIIWSNVDAAIVKSATRLMNLAFENWTQKEDLTKFQLLLNRLDVDLYLFKYGFQFVKFIKTFQNKTDLSEIFTDDFLDLVETFGRRGLRLTSAQLNNLIETVWRDTPPLRRFVERLLRVTLPNVTTAVLFNSFSRNVSQLLVPYCFQLTDENIYDLICNCEPDELPLILEFSMRMFTITKSKKEMVVLLLSRIDVQLSDRFRLSTQGSNDVKTLLELSRDVLKRYFRYNMYNTRQYITVLDQMQLPAVIKDIIQYKVAMHSYIW